MSDDNIRYFYGVTTHDIPAERILDAAKESDLDVCIVVGTAKDGEFYFASSASDGADVLWWLEIAKKKLLEMRDEEE